MTQFTDALAKCPVIPVVTLNHSADAVPLAEALLQGGITTIEITLRTPAGLAAIEAVGRSNLPICVGAGTVFTPQQFADVVQAGAEFAISPASPPELLSATQGSRVPLLPGTITPTEVAAAAAHGHTMQKFFPAAAFGGAAVLKQYVSVFPHVTFCPTGGVTVQNMNDYLSLPNVVAVGGTWLAPADLVANRDWPAIASLAQKATESAKG